VGRSCGDGAVEPRSIAAKSHCVAAESRGGHLHNERMAGGSVKRSRAACVILPAAVYRAASMEQMSVSRAELEAMPRPELLALAAELSWVHRVDLGDGVVSEGLWGDGNPEIAHAMNDIDFSSKKVLDIGCWDGRHSFEAEERGAQFVLATDLISQRSYAGLPTFEVARAARGSNVVYDPNLSVYDIEDAGIRDFDVVIFAGVYYHLKDPLAAFAALRRVMAPDATILVEGAVLEEPGCFAKFYYRESYCSDDSNWWLPTVECLRQWIGCSRLDITREYGRWGAPHNPRHAVLAKAVVGADSLHVYPDERLAQFMA
jgi:tRNA (mo5U34)-methyltransferase